jgi:hypothetical protein
MVKKRVIVSYKNLHPEVQKIMNDQYPDGYYDDIIKVDKGNNAHFYAVIVETEEVKYLVKVDVRIDHLIDEPDGIATSKKNNDKNPSYEIEEAPINETELMENADQENNDSGDNYED